MVPPPALIPMVNMTELQTGQQSDSLVKKLAQVRNILKGMAVSYSCGDLETVDKDSDKLATSALWHYTGTRDAESAEDVKAEDTIGNGISAMRWV